MQLSVITLYLNSRDKRARKILLEFVGNERNSFEQNICITGQFRTFV